VVVVEQPQVQEHVGGVTPSDVTAWLRAQGWSETGRLGDLATRWQSDEGGVVVPMLLSAPDFGLRWSEMVVSLSTATGLDEQGMLLAVARSGSDIAEFRAQGGAIDDSLPLGDAEVLIASVRRAMVASANSAVQPRSYFGHSIPDAARNHARNVRMGHTRRGSYIVPVISKLPTLEAEDEEDARLFEDEVFQPFSRASMLRLAEGLTALQRITHDETLPPRSVINESVGSGVSYELCEAVANVLETNSVEGLSVTFSWAERLAPVSAPTQVTIAQGTAPILRELSAYLLGEQVVGQQTLIGFVKVLDRGEDDEVGKVVIRALDSDMARNVSMLLPDEFYDTASQANNERRMVSVTGQLERQPGRALRFVSVSDFSLVEQLPPY
jgi:hypothetical protein